MLWVLVRSTSARTSKKYQQNIFSCRIKKIINLIFLLILSYEVFFINFQLISTVKAYDPMIERLPKMEEELSLLLNGIQIIRRQSQEVVMAQTYEVLLNRMLNSVRRSQDDVLRGFRMEDLSHLVMVVER